VKVVVKLLRPRGKGASAKVKRVRGPEGQLVTVRALDSGRSTFGADLRNVFATNVSKARRENRAVVGTTDRAPAKR
jgi:hypothetical protein